MQENFDWAGTRILRRTTIFAKRWVVGNMEKAIPTDIREWICCPDSQEIRNALTHVKLPSNKVFGSFDIRAREIWKYVVENIEYKCDLKSNWHFDFWQFSAETLALGKGDCEDLSFLLASLLIASEISPFCVRVVLGKVYRKGRNICDHAWVVYKDETGQWRLLDPTIHPGNFPDQWPLADDFSLADSEPRYKPEICFNQNHVWEIKAPRVEDMSVYIKERRERKSLKTGKVSPE